MIKATGGSNLCDAESCVTEKVTADLHTVIIQKGDRRLGQIFLKIREMKLKNWLMKLE